MKPYLIIPREKKDKKHCRIWSIEIPVGKRDGRTRYKAKRFHGTYSEAVAEAAQLAKQIGGTCYAGETFASYAEYFTKIKVAVGQISKQTADKNGNLLKMLSRHIGNLPLCSITAKDIERCYSALRKGDSPSGKEISGTTLSCAHTVAWGLFEHARQSNLIKVNPCEAAMRPRPDTKEKKALSISESAELLLALDLSVPYHRAILLMVECGLRVGEVCALRWSDITDKIYISGTMHNDGLIYPPKTRSSIRAIPMPIELAMKLEPFREDGFVVVNYLGQKVTPSTIRHWWNRHRSEFGLEEYTLHELRHTFASNLAESNVHPRLMQALLGHASPNVSLQIYAHVHTEQLAQAMQLKADRMTEK